MTKSTISSELNSGTKVDAKSAKQYIDNKYFEVIESNDSTNILYRTNLISLCDLYLKEYPEIVIDSILDIAIYYMRQSIEGVRLVTFFERGRIKALAGDVRGGIEDMSEAIIACKKPFPPLLANKLPLFLRVRGYSYMILKQLDLACADWREAINLGDTYSLEHAKNYCQ